MQFTVMNEQLIRRITQCPNLPSLPAIAVQVLELTQHADINLAEIARLISKDPALAGKILRTVNSSFYGRSQNVGTISHALVILGLQSVRTLVLGFSLVTHLNKEKGKGFDYLGYWRRSIYAANAARALAAKVGIVQQEEAFLAALLQDIGMLVLERVLGPEYGQICGAVVSHGDLAAAETAALGMNHAQVGELLAREWHLPPLLALPIAGHLSPADVPDPSLRRLTELVALAGSCADIFVGLSAASTISHVREQCKLLYKMSEAECDAILDQVGRSTKDIASLFEIHIGQGLSFDDVLKKANEALVEITLKSQQQASSLRQQNQQLQRVASTDGLTGLANRGRFEQFLAEEFALACKDGKPLSLILLDVDRFKLVNDRLGHPVGDQVLKAVAKLVGSVARATDLAARYGGEEMVLVLPATARSTAAAIAESLRHALAARPVVCSITQVPVTASFGVASLDPSVGFKEPAHLVKAADMAVYAAKHAGRNCVKIFTPRAAQAPSNAA
jgi:two-component system, cell cycle response regulator